MLKRVMGGLIDMVYPKTCLVCKTKLKGNANIDQVVCAECWGKIKRNLPPFCHSCGRQLKKTNLTKNICPACVRRRLHFDRALSPCVYEGVAKELIQEFKYKNKDYLGPTLSRLMTEFIKEYNIPMDYLDVIIPVPLHKTKLREREFNQAKILSDNIAREFNKLVLPDVLTRKRLTKTQTELKDDERITNVLGAFSVERGDEIKGKSILLIDDVLTTGATSSEAARALKEAGANIVFVLTLAN